MNRKTLTPATLISSNYPPSDFGVDMQSLSFQLDKNEQLKGLEKDKTTSSAGTMAPILREGDPSMSADTISQITDPDPS
jgi:hypothetical protein